MDISWYLSHGMYITCDEFLFAVWWFNWTYFANKEIGEGRGTHATKSDDDTNRVTNQLPHFVS